MADDFIPLVAAGVLHDAARPVVIVRDRLNIGRVRTACDQIVVYPGPDWTTAARRVCARCLPGESLESLLALDD